MREPGWYTRIFGTGPRGLAISLALLAVAWFVAEPVGLPHIHGSPTFGAAAGIVGTLLALVGAAWSVKSLPVETRGRDLITTGAFARVRHPLYAAFLIFFDFGLALWLDNWILILWAVAQFPIWWVNVQGEERLMANLFGAQWEDYRRHTGRLLPRLVLPRLAR